MAQLEKYFSETFAISALDGAYHTVTGFPAVAAGTSLLVTSVFFYFTGTFGAANIQDLRVTNGANNYEVVVTDEGSVTDNTGTLIGPTSEFVLLPGDILKYRYTNDNTGNLRITIFYRLIPGGDTDNGIYFSAVRGLITSTDTTITLVTGTNIVFLKSLIIVNSSATTNFNIYIGDWPLKSLNIVQDTSAVAIQSDEKLFKISGQDIYFESVGNTGYYYLSYYYDPLYTT